MATRMDELMDQAFEQGRGEIMSGLAECTEAQRDLFRRAHGGDPIEKTVSAMPRDKISTALELVRRTLRKATT